jgi:NDP-sugar pyrophosphorylase family protein
MKVVSFCGGYGVRMRTVESDLIPKPRQTFGPRSLLWRVMRYSGHKDFSAADVGSANDRLDVLVESGDR